jgi:hypothetical protein
MSAWCDGRACARRTLRRVPRVLLLLSLVLPSACVILPGGRSVGRFDPATRAAAADARNASEVSQAASDPELDDIDSGPVELPGVIAGQGSSAPLTASRLQSELLAFADRYQEAIAEASDNGAERADSASSRAGFVQLKVVYVTAAITSVTEPEPLRVLRDLLVMVRLQRMVWATNAHTWAAPPARTRFQKVLSRLEQQLLQLAARVYSPQDINTIHELTSRWHAANPERRYVAFVRFHDLDDSDQKRQFETRVNGGGLLAPITKANAELEEMRRVAERALFLANHMPMLLEWQAEAYLNGALGLPEVQAFSQNFTQLTDTASRFSSNMEVLPDRIASERAATLSALATLIERERSATLTQLGAQLQDQRSGLMADLKSASGDLRPLAEHLSKASENMRETLSLLNSLRATSSESGVDLDAVNTTVLNMTTLAGDTSRLLEAVQGIVAGGANSTAGVARLDALLTAHERRLFFYALTLLLAAGVVLFGAIAFARRKSA